MQLCQGPRQTKKTGVLTSDLSLLGSAEFRVLFTQCCETARSHFSFQLRLTELLNLWHCLMKNWPTPKAEHQTTPGFLLCASLFSMILVSQALDSLLAWVPVLCTVPGQCQDCWLPCPLAATFSLALQALNQTKTNRSPQRKERQRSWVKLWPLHFFCQMWLTCVSSHCLHGNIFLYIFSVPANSWCYFCSQMSMPIIVQNGSFFTCMIH